MFLFVAVMVLIASWTVSVEFCELLGFVLKVLTFSNVLLSIVRSGSGSSLFW